MKRRSSDSLHNTAALCLLVLAVLAAPRCVHAQEETTPEDPLSEAAVWAVEALQQYRVVPGITYLVADGYESKLDVYTPRGSEPVPTVVYIHGGGWVGGSKERYALWGTRPYMEKGMAVVNVAYRLGREALAARLHEALDEAGAPNRLVTIEGAGHGGRANGKEAYRAMWDFLRTHDVLE